MYVFVFVALEAMKSEYATLTGQKKNIEHELSKLQAENYTSTASSNILRQQLRFSKEQLDNAKRNYEEETTRHKKNIEKYAERLHHVAGALKCHGK